MPELPEVQTVVDTLRPGLVGRRIIGVRIGPHDVVRPAGFDLAHALVGRVVVTICRRAKRIVVKLDDAQLFYFHLGMTGRLTLASCADEAKKHTHFTAELDDGRLLRFVDARRFGGIHWLGPTHEDGHIGPEPLAIRATVLARRIATTGRAIKTALLDQSVIAGIGNIYADESLWAARIHPTSPARELDAAQIQRLAVAIRQTLRRAIAAGGSTLRDYVDAHGRPGGFQRLHRVYDRAGQACNACKAPIERIVLGGRSTHFCPACQTRERRR